jgi:MFS family permease
MRVRSFAFLWTSSLASGFALQMLVVAIGVQVYLIHEDPLDLGLVGLAEFLPLLVFALPAGQIADRFSRRTVVAVGLVFQIVIATTLVLITLSGADELWPFLTVGAIAGTASALTNPAGRALTPEIVPTELLPGAIALRSVANQLGIVVGPAVGAVIFKFEPVAVYITAGALFLVGFVAILLARSRSTSSPCSSATRSRSRPCSRSRFFTSAPSASACCEPRRRSERCSRASSSRGARSATAPAQRSSQSSPPSAR